MKNKYQTWYYNIIDRARNRVLTSYTELHHIIPHSLGGSDESTNLVALTAREHFICHILLTKFTTGQDRNKMLHAAILMKGENNLQQRYFNARLYETVRIAYAEKRSIEQQGIGNSFFGKHHSAETKAKMSASKKENYSNGNHPHIGMKRSEEAKANISKSKKGKPSSKKGLPGVEWSEATRVKMTVARLGKMFWWTNDINNVRAASCPDGYKKGRTMSPNHYAKFATKS